MLYSLSRSGGGRKDINMNSRVYRKRLRNGLDMSALHISSSLLLATSLLVGLPGSPSVVCCCGGTVGDHWTYDLEMVVEGVPVTGAVRYDFFGSEPALYEGVNGSVDILRVSGHFEGDRADATVITSAAGVLDGWRYRVGGSISTVMDELTTIINLTYTVGAMSTIGYVERYDGAVFTPPLMSGFDDESKTLGEVWDEMVEVERKYSFDDGSSSVDEEHVSNESYSFLIESVDAVKETPAGEFSCVVINMSYATGHEVIWHSRDVGMPVSIERYDDGASAPCYSVVLSELSVEDDLADWLMPLIYIGTAISAVVLLAVIVLVVIRFRTATTPPEMTESADGRGDDISKEDDDSH